MASSYSLFPDSDFYSRFQIQNRLPELLSVPKAVPGSFMPVIYYDKGRVIDIMRWGFTPQWAKDLSFGAKNFHAPSETILESTVFRGSFNSCRCLVPASAIHYYLNTSLQKENYSLTLKGESVFSLAGLYSLWESPDGSYLPTFAVMTVPAPPPSPPLPRPYACHFVSRLRIALAQSHRSLRPPISTHPLHLRLLIVAYQTITPPRLLCYYRE